MKQREVLTGLFLQPIQVMEEVARSYRKYVALAVVIWLISEFAGSYAFQEPFRTVFRGLIAMLIFAFWIYKVPFWFGGKTRLKNFITLYGLARLPISRTIPHGVSRTHCHAYFCVLDLQGSFLVWRENAIEEFYYFVWTCAASDLKNHSARCFADSLPCLFLRSGSTRFLFGLAGKRD